MSTNSATAQFHEEVFPRELEEIRRRRAAAGGPELPPAAAPSTRLGLVGLALSGGGIRSATFSLGVIQALARHGRFERVDYLSTVSGGGYIGSCLSSLLNDPGSAPHADFPLRKELGSPEPPALSHLRNASKYLSSGGLLELLRIPMLLLRGILLNFLLLFPWLYVAVLVTELVYELPYLQLTTPVPFLLLALLGLTFLLLVTTFPFVFRFFRGRFGWPLRNGYELLLSASLGAVLLMLVLVPVSHLVVAAIEMPWGGKYGARALLAHFAGNPWLWWIVLAGSAVFMLAFKASQRVARWSGKLMLYALGLLAPAVVFAIYLLLCVPLIDSPYVAADLAQPLAAAARGEAADLGDVLDAFERKGLAFPEENPTVTETDEGWTVAAGDTTYHVLKVYRRDGRLWKLEIAEFAPDLWDEPHPGMPFSDKTLFAVFLLSILFIVLFLDVNLTSLHSFYRDRLSKAFLIRRRDGGVEPNDEQKLSQLCRDGSRAPYHLINAAINLSGSRDPDLRGRNAGIFLFSKLFTGGPHTGYCATTDLERADPHLDLGSAMAISAAAASPNMGTTTIRPLVFVMALLNLRLGYWLPDPAKVKDPRRRRWIRLRRASLSFLLKEALGKLDAASHHVNVSDGGHIENLGLYELLRRRCSLIIAVDGEADRDMTFGSLTVLLRYARIDLGVEIETALDELRPGGEGWSARHWTVFKIRYGRDEQGRDEVGHLIYVKASLTGDESEDVLRYRAENPTFPHQTTADQFFAEPQFEAYRVLGEHVGDSLFASEEVRQLLDSTP